MTIRDADKNDLRNTDVRQLVAYALGAPDPTKIAAALARVDMSKTTMILAEEGSRVVGQAIVTTTLPDSRDVVIDNISIAEDRRGEGIGRLLFDAILSRYPETRICTETDRDAVGFYHSLGFRIRSVGELYLGVVRYDCEYDDADWKPPCHEPVVRQLLQAGVRCWVAGGEAIDLFVGRRTREHADTDILICRQDQRRLLEVFPGWEVYHTHTPRLRRWQGERFLSDVPNVWVSLDFHGTAKS